MENDERWTKKAINSTLSFVTAKRMEDLKRLLQLKETRFEIGDFEWLFPITPVCWVDTPKLPGGFSTPERI